MVVWDSDSRCPDPDGLELAITPERARRFAAIDPARIRAFRASSQVKARRAGG